MEKLITYIIELNQLLKQDKIEIAKQKAKELKKLYPEDAVPDFIEAFIHKTFSDKKKIQESNIEIKNYYRLFFYLYQLIKDTKIENDYFFTKHFENEIIENSFKNKNITNLYEKLESNEKFIHGFQLSILGFTLFEVSVLNQAKIKYTIKSLYKAGFTKNDIYGALYIAYKNINLEWYNIEFKPDDWMKFTKLWFHFIIEPLEKVTIKNYFSIEEIEISDLNNKKEIYFLGENGDGKTILLQAILLALKGNTGNETIFSYINQNEIFQSKASNSKRKLSLTAKLRQLFDYKFETNHKIQESGYQNIFAYGVNRLRKSDKEPEKEGYLTLFDADTYLTSPTQWLKDIQLDYLNYQNKKGKKQLHENDIEPISPKQAKILLEQVINFEEDINKFQIIIDGTDIKFKEKGTSLEFEQLSDGYKSILILLSDLLSQLSNKQPFIENINDYLGIVIIDELGVFLHPKWEFEIARVLRKLFPNIQWIFSTHSPIAILGATSDAVFYKLYKKDGKTKISKPFSPKTFSNKLITGYITSPLFNMPTAKPIAYQYSNVDFETGDYIYSIIHKEVKSRLSKEPLQDDEIKKMVKKLLDKFEKSKK